MNGIVSRHHGSHERGICEALLGQNFEPKESGAPEIITFLERLVVADRAAELAHCTLMVKLRKVYTF